MHLAPSSGSPGKRKPGTKGLTARRRRQKKTPSVRRGFPFGLVVQQHDQNDQPDRMGAVWRIGTLPHVPSRVPPPSSAASAAQNAPMKSESVSQIAVCIAVFLAFSKSALARLLTSLTRFSASAWLNPVRDETSFTR